MPPADENGKRYLAMRVDAPLLDAVDAIVPKGGRTAWVEEAMREKLMAVGTVRPGPAEQSAIVEQGWREHVEGVPPETVEGVGAGVEKLAEGLGASKVVDVGGDPPAKVPASEVKGGVLTRAQAAQAAALEEPPATTMAARKRAATPAKAAAKAPAKKAAAAKKAGPKLDTKAAMHCKHPEDKLGAPTRSKTTGLVVRPCSACGANAIVR